MNANELMIEDWVGYYSKDRIKGNPYPLQIHEIRNKSITLVSNSCLYQVADLNELSPIPLTPEILEKNGWEYNNYNNEIEYEEEYYIDENGFDIHINGEKFEVRCIDAVNIQLKYLHELQHLLKLCGIEKTIEL